MPLTIKVDNNALKSASTSLSAAASNIEPIVNKISNLRIDNPKIKKSIKAEMESSIDNLASELEKLQTYIVQFADDTNVILKTIKELDEKYDSLSVSEKSALSVFKSADENILNELIKSLNAAGLMTANGLFSSALFESPDDLGTFVADGYESREAWRKALVSKYVGKGFTEADAEAVAAYDMAVAETKATGATVLAGGITLSSIYDSRREALQNKIESDKAKKAATNNISTAVDNTASQETTSNGGGGGNSTGTDNYPSVQYRTTDSTPTPTPSNEQAKVETNNTTSGNSSSSPTNANNENTNNNSSNTQTETPATDNNSNDNSNTNTNTGQNNNSNTNTNTGQNNNSNMNTNTGQNNNSNTITIPGANAENNTPINNGTTNTNTGSTSGNTYYGPNNNSSGSSNNNPTIITDPSADIGNAATTTPSAPESDAGIVDKSGEELDVISIDKEATSTPSTSSNDGGSVIPTILGVGAAGAAAVAGVKFIKNKKEKDNTYEDDFSEDDNSFSYLNNNEITDNSYNENVSTGKYKAGNVNELVLDNAPDDLKIESSMKDITNKKEELE